MDFGQRLIPSFEQLLVTMAGGKSRPTRKHSLAIAAGLPAKQLVAALVPNGPLVVTVDDRLFKKTGRKVYGCHFWQDPLLSTAQRVVTRWG